MGYANEASYEAVISSLQQYVGNISDSCTVMSAAAQDCVDNTYGDPASIKSAQAVNQCVNSINQSASKIQEVIQALKDELERIKEYSRKVDSVNY